MEIISAAVSAFVGFLLGAGCFSFGYVTGRRQAEKQQQRTAPADELKIAEDDDAAEQARKMNRQWKNIMDYTGR